MMQHCALTDIQATSHQLPEYVYNDSQGALQAPVMMPIEEDGV